ncbi:MAG: DUF2135 domain-containing protein [Spirochaetales bacterium]|nr:DUF2135 domain-containing protein [Spirochaetales bacterium]
MKNRLFALLLLVPAILAWSDDRLGLSAEDEGQLRISRLEVKSIINGRLAQTEITASFYNHTDRTLSGELIVPLADGAVINGFALDIGGVMVDGVIVEKDKGRQVFEAIQRQGIDPGLLEKVTGNNFRTRVFPLPAKGYRTVKISWVHTLPEKQGRLVYQLPLRLDKAVDSFSLYTEIVKSTIKPDVVLKGLDHLKTLQVRDSFIVSATESNVRLGGDLEIFLPVLDRNNLIVEKGPDGYSYFVAFEKAVETGKSLQKQPHLVSLFWDASSSMTEEKRNKACAFLAELLSQWKSCTVEVFVLREKAEQAVRFNIKKGSAADLLAYLNGLEYDGASALRDLPAVSPGSELALLVSDGIANFGSSRVSAVNKPVYTAAVGQGADYDFLKSLAWSSGGVYVNLENTDANTAAEKLLVRQSDYSINKQEQKNILELYPASLQAADSFIMISGRFSGKAELVYHSVRGGNRKIPVSDAGAVEGNLARTFFGMQKLAGALLDPDADKQGIIEIGRTYSLATPTTSFIVLDSVDQYLQYGIEPPKSMPDWRREYFNVIQTRDNQQARQREDKITRMLGLWKNKIDWWNTEFKYPENYRHVDKEGKDRETDIEETENGAEIHEEMRPAAPAEAERTMSGRGMTSATEPLFAADIDDVVEKKADADKAEYKSSITINAWDPDTPYLKKIKQSGRPYQTYLELKASYGSTPSFYLDCGDYFEKQKETNLAIRIWSNIAEMQLDNHQLLRNLGHRLHQAGALSLSEQVFRKVLELRPEEPQSCRDLALVLAEEEKYVEAIALLYKVVITPWQRFDEIELIALVEMNNIIACAERKNIRGYVVDKRFIKNLACDVRIILTWDADLTDMDLWVTEPSGEKAFYGNRNTVIGGSFSRDFTEGYGPEEYLLHRAMKGKYKIEVNYYSSQALTLSGTVTLQIDVFTDYGTPKQQKKSITIRLSENKETLLVGEIEM